MLITELIPNAKPIDFNDIQAGDLIARPRKGVTLVAIATKQTDIHGPAKWLSEDPETFAAIKGREHYLVHRPATPLPTELGSMIRIIDSGTYSTKILGEVFTQNEFGDWIGLNERFGRLMPISEGMTWEQVYYTTDIHEQVVDAVILPAEDEPAPAEPKKPLPVAPGLLVHVLSGLHEGALMRCEIGGNYFEGVRADGGICGMPRSQLEKYDWEVVNVTRDRAFYADQPF